MSVLDEEDLEAVLHGRLECGLGFSVGVGVSITFMMVAFLRRVRMRRRFVGVAHSTATREMSTTRAAPSTGVRDAMSTTC